MASETISMEQLRRTMPWRELIHPNGLVQVIDREGKEVPLLVITAFVQSVSEKMAIREAASSAT